MESRLYSSGVLEPIQIEHELNQDKLDCLLMTSVWYVKQIRYM